MKELTKEEKAHQAISGQERLFVVEVVAGHYDDPQSFSISITATSILNALAIATVEVYEMDMPNTYITGIHEADHPQEEPDFQCD